MAERLSLEYKVVLLGEGCVGKTSIFLRYTEDKFSEKHDVTLQAAFRTKKLTLSGKRVSLHIWDTAGQEKFHAIAPIYYRDSRGAILVYDITDANSFDRVKIWVKELRRMCGSDLVLAIVGNKTDMERDRHVQEQNAIEYAGQVGAKHFHCSAKLNKGIEELFLDLTRRLISSQGESNYNARSPTRPQPSLDIVDDTPEEKRNSCC
ncbi:Ras-related protein Rab-21-like [Oopsacas minuta]|uniref:Ras-related protein Rab-21 n=1 Tax=Oopsacas minuta TaxID=111878 RepID=A0AAV7JRY7_9METZ|nr:Ras-related protein Rab-21-like [Oopsacas minuta]